MIEHTHDLFAASHRVCCTWVGPDDASKHYPAIMFMGRAVWVGECAHLTPRAAVSAAISRAQNLVEADFPTNDDRVALHWAQLAHAGIYEGVNA